MGLFVTDLARMENLYTRVLGFTATDRGEMDTPQGRVELVFLSRDPNEHHQIVLVTGRPADAGFNTINQISFRAESFAALREMYRRLQSEAVSEIAPACHGNALSVYFKDSEGNRIELFIDTPWYCRQPMRVPMDMNMSDPDLWKWAETQARGQPDFKPMEEWRSGLAEKIR